MVTFITLYVSIISVEMGQRSQEPPHGAQQNGERIIAM